MTDVAFACSCGTVTGRVAGIGRGTGLHLGCHCADCRCADLALRQPDPRAVAPAGLRPGPVHLYQTSPDRVILDTGDDRLALLRLRPASKTYRWYAACCDAPLFNTGPRPGFPYASLHIARVDRPEALGPMRAEAFVPQPGGGTAHRHIARFAYSVITTGLATRLSGRWKRTPFFDIATGQPNGPERVLTKDERAALPCKS